MRYEVAPLHDYVIYFEQEVKEIAGIFTPQGGKEEKSRSFGRVLAVGPGRIDNNGHLIPMTVKPGDLIVIGGRNSMVRYDHLDDARKVYAIREPEIAGRIKEDPSVYTHRAFDAISLCGSILGSMSENDKIVTCPKCVEKMIQLVMS